MLTKVSIVLRTKYQLSNVMTPSAESKAAFWHRGMGITGISFLPVYEERGLLALCLEVQAQLSALASDWQEPTARGGKTGDGPIYLQWRDGTYPIHGERLKGFFTQVTQGNTLNQLSDNQNHSERSRPRSFKKIKTLMCCSNVYLVINEVVVQCIDKICRHNLPSVVCGLR